ncbi:MAG: PilX N-terminal domain-containing pilus assembly protein [Lysobacterales bacterium]
MTPRSVANSCGAARPQRGMVLLLCLIFLMALTLLGLSASSDTILQRKLAANLQDAQRAKQSALLALDWAENWLLSQSGPAPETCVEPCDGLHLHAEGSLPPHPEFENLSWWMANGHEAGIDPLTGDRMETISSDSINAPVWIITTVKYISPAESGNPDLQVWYRILARGSGRSETAVSVIESVVVRSWPGSEPPSTGEPGACPGTGTAVICGRFSWRELL